MKSTHVKKTKNDIVVGIITLVFWYILAVAMVEFSLKILSLFLNEISSALFLGIEIVAVLLAYLMVLGKSVKFTEPLHKKKSLARVIFFTGSIALILASAIDSLSQV